MNILCKTWGYRIDNADVISIILNSIIDHVKWTQVIMS